MSRLIAASLAALILVASSVSVSAAVAADCPASQAAPVTVTIPDIGQTGPGDTATPAPTPTACPTATATPTTPPPAGTAPAGSAGGSTSGGSSTGSGASAPAAPAGATGEVVAPTPPSTPSENASKLELDPERLAVLEWMTAAGTGYPAGEQVQFVLYPGADVIGSFVADASGNVSARFRIPEETRPGAHVVEATGWASKRVSNGEFMVVTATAAGAGAVGTLWWVVVLCGALFLGLVVMAIYFRRSIASAFRGGPETVGGTP